jgi:hypothetical protein
MVPAKRPGAKRRNRERQHKRRASGFIAWFVVDDDPGRAITVSGVMVGDDTVSVR